MTYDPFKAWQTFQDSQPSRRVKNRLDETINPGQLHDPKDFIKKLREVSAETASNAAALEQFMEAHDGDPAWSGQQWRDELTTSLSKLGEIANELTRLVRPIEQALLQQEQREETGAQRESGGTSVGGPLFRK